MSGFSLFSFIKEAGGLVLAGVALAWFNGWINVGTIQTFGKSPEDIAAVEQSAHYSNCSAARAAGAAPLHRGDPGYAAHLDRDGDGAACEPYYGL